MTPRLQLIYALSAAVLVACGGGGSDAPPAPAPEAGAPSPAPAPSPSEPGGSSPAPAPTPVPPGMVRVAGIVVNGTALQPTATLRYDCRSTSFGSANVTDGQYSFLIEADRLPCLVSHTTTEAAVTRVAYAIAMPEAGQTTVRSNVSTISTMVTAATAGGNDSGPDYATLRTAIVNGNTTGLADRLAAAYSRVNATFTPHLNETGEWAQRLATMEATPRDFYGEIDYGVVEFARPSELLTDRSVNRYDLIDAFARSAVSTAYSAVHGGGRTKYSLPPEAMLYRSLNTCKALKRDMDYIVFRPLVDQPIDGTLARWRVSYGGLSIQPDYIQIDETGEDGSTGSQTFTQQGVESCHFLGGGNNPRQFVVSPSGVLVGKVPRPGYSYTDFVIAVPANQVQPLSALTSTLTGTSGWVGAGFYYPDVTRKFLGRVESMRVSDSGAITDYSGCWSANWSLTSCPAVSGTRSFEKRGTTNNLFNVVRDGEVEGVAALYRAGAGNPLLIWMEKGKGISLFTWAGEDTVPTVGERFEGYELTAASEAGNSWVNGMTPFSQSVTAVSGKQATYNHSSGELNSVTRTHGVTTSQAYADRQAGSFNYARELSIRGHGLTMHVEANAGSGTIGRTVKMSVAIVPVRTN